ncbi:hypothetical protein F4780DRAFT_3510 [Xylariomycetidae sp. FL0641]|nr:hypothetical protein F4780DRAFT_3510 [Xylariomycetidae sp. FL0641]
MSLSGTTPLLVATSLPPQTTPFVPPIDASECSKLPVWCPGWPSDFNCYAGDLNDNNGTCTPDFYRSDCYPSGYQDIYSATGTWDDQSETAFPGTACLSGWSTGCTTTISASNSNISQAWCCPTGFSCPGSDWAQSFTGLITPSRVCTSQIQVSDVVYVRANKTSYTPTVLSASAWTSTPELASLLAIRPVFPLQSQSPDNSTESEQVAMFDTPRLVGAIVGSVLGALVLVLGAVLFRRRLIRQRRSKRTQELDATNAAGQDDGEAKGFHGFDAKAELPPNMLWELPAGNDPAELHSDAIAEVDSSYPPAELPSEAYKKGGIDAGVVKYAGYRRNEKYRREGASKPA